MAVDDGAVVHQAVLQRDADVRGGLLGCGQGADEMHFLEGFGHCLQADTHAGMLRSLGVSASIFSADGHASEGARRVRQALALVSSQPTGQAGDDLQGLIC